MLANDGTCYDLCSCFDVYKLGMERFNLISDLLYSVLAMRMEDVDAWYVKLRVLLEPLSIDPLRLQRVMKDLYKESSLKIRAPLVRLDSEVRVPLLGLDEGE